MIRWLESTQLFSVSACSISRSVVMLGLGVGNVLDCEFYEAFGSVLG